MISPSSDKVKRSAYVANLVNGRAGRSTLAGSLGFWSLCGAGSLHDDYDSRCTAFPRRSEFCVNRLCNFSYVILLRGPMASLP